MTTRPYFSIIVPVYNVQDYLVKCVQSILAQSFTDFELLLINDGSTDSSLQHCQDFAHQFPEQVKLFSQDNQGVSAARNLGLQHAQGKYILFIDGDDYVSADHLENLHTALESGSCSMIFNEIYFEKDGTKTASHFGKADKNKIISLDKTIEYCSHGMGFLGLLLNKTFDNHIIQNYQIRFNEQVHQREDRLFCLDYLLAVRANRPDAKALILDAPTYHYVARSTSQMNQINAKTYTALYAQKIIEDKTNFISKAIKKWNTSKKISDTLYLFSYASHHPELMTTLDPKSKKILFDTVNALTKKAFSTSFYLLATSTLSFKQKLQLLRLLQKTCAQSKHGPAD